MQRSEEIQKSVTNIKNMKEKFEEQRKEKINNNGLKIKDSKNIKGNNIALNYRNIYALLSQSGNTQDLRKFLIQSGEHQRIIPQYNKCNQRSYTNSQTKFEKVNK